MVARLWCGGLQGVDAFRVDLEVDVVRQGLPAFVLVGLAEGAVREARERVFGALRAAGFKLPPSRITVNLAPADRRKEGSAYDLPLAVALLMSAGVLPPERGEGWLLAGELSLTGAIKPIPGILPLAMLARSEGARGMIVSPENAAEASMVEGLQVFAMQSLGDAVAFLGGTLEASPVPFAAPKLESAPYAMDYADVKGQEHAKRAIEIAAAGGHNLLFIGPPGSGKSMLARRIPSVLPPLAFEEALEVTKIYSVAGKLEGKGLVTVRPFLEQHPTASEVSLVGGGTHPRPGAVSLAHRGVLFLDELPEYPRGTLEVLRQPLETGEVTVSRAAQTVVFPADCMLVAAMNPCPCGYLGDPGHACTCTPQQIQRYRSKISGPLLDRIDLHIHVPAVPYEDLQSRKTGTDSAAMRARITAARAVQSARYRGIPGCRTNADLNGRLLAECCEPDAEGRAFLREAVRSLSLSARAYTRILRISRTIADMEGAESLSLRHLAEAVGCRVLDRERH
ncbi:MAG: YifB family Mg chelatase-like AAA ATPase [Desulfovibrionaceae bacterium]|nr:YifB family Mg chelatase-like AAA ATPase [Desulfovibrionaceae bacterium]